MLPDTARNSGSASSRAACAALRLARFNASIDDPNKPAFAANYFTGVPAPAGAITVLLPIYLAFLGVPMPPATLTAFYTLLIAFLMVLIIRTGLQIRHETRPPANFTPTKDGLFSARGNTPKKFSLTIWTHQALDALWLLNGVIFVVLLIVTGHWARIVPTDPHVFQHALSAGIQYLSLDWPTENGWVHYNALQMLSYALVVFVAAPLAALTGWRMSSWFPTEAKGLNKAFPMEVARKVHFPVMVFFVAFIVVHVFLVAFTGLLTNLNHMYTSRGGATDAWGLVVFLVSVAVTAAAWFFLKPAFTAPVASRFGTVGR